MLDVWINAAHDAAFTRADTHLFPNHECDSAEHSLFLKIDSAAQSGPDTTDQKILRSGALLFGLSLPKTPAGHSNLDRPSDAMPTLVS
jgi:hypothetical protein